MSEANILLINEIKKIERGSGIETTPLVTPHSVPHAKFVTGMSVYPKGQGHHNCDEQVTLLGGVGEVEVEGKTTAIGLDEILRNEDADLDQNEAIWTI